MNTATPHHKLETENEQYRKASEGATPDQLAEVIKEYRGNMEMLRAVISGEELWLTIPEAAVVKIKRLEARVTELEEQNAKLNYNLQIIEIIAKTCLTLQVGEFNKEKYAHILTLAQGEL